MRPNPRMRSTPELLAQPGWVSLLSNDATIRIAAHQGLSETCPFWALLGVSDIGACRTAE